MVNQYFVSSDAGAVKPSAKTILTNGSFVVLAVLAVAFAVAKAKHFHREAEAGAMVWFYDQNTKSLYAAPRGLIPPDGRDEMRVRATVVGFQGMGNKVGQLKIAYLEKYTPEFKALLERAEAAHAAQRPFEEKIPSQSSTYFQQNTLVKRPDETSWHNFGSVEARQSMAEWHNWRGPAGQPPIISVPSVQ